ncbi:MAG: hypothetical protein J6D47_16525 [Peptostreptococcaceae bacterium]|nr:hypothetical protein [Peptostreptococcaceae bacterium]
MAKVWKDIDEVVKATVEVPQKYWKSESIMREKPNFDKKDSKKKKRKRKVNNHH